VNRIREALGDSAGSPRYIETVPRKGYRFIAETEPVAAVSEGPVAPAELSRSAAFLERPASRRTLLLVSPVSMPGRLVGIFADGIEELRTRNHVILIPASPSQKTLGEIPAGSYGFVFAPFVAHSAPNALHVYNHNDPAYFEVHKLSGGQTEFVGYVGSETKERLQKGLSAGEMLTLYTSSWKDATNLTAISFASVKCMRSRDVNVRRKGGTIVLFALDCKATQRH